MNLSQAASEFILHWGEMGTRWGVNRTVAQVHALLYLSPESLTAEEIAETLSVARSNVSTSLKELQNWNLVQIDNRIGDRRDFFRTSADVWTLFLTVVEQRFEREIVPTLSTLRRCVATARAEASPQAPITRRMAAMLEFLEDMHGWYMQVMKLPPATLHSLMSIGSGITRILPKTKRRRLD
jgi:DNA-binding transcriptional regulator GbsR (MarR family)